MSVTINGTNGLVFNDNSTQNTSPFTGGFGFRNRIINGAMVIDQRNNGSSVTPANAQYTLDRWQSVASVSSKYSIQRNAGSVTPPAGFANYLGVTSLSSYSVGSGEIFGILQPIEGFNTSDLGFGAANAQTVTLSFWVRSSLTGTFGGSLSNGALNRSYPFSYTISAANTWELETITISGDTAGTWVGATNGVGLNVQFSLGTGTSLSGTAGAWAGSFFGSTTGAVSVVGTNGATFYITGVQLEKGSTATSFDYRPYGTELDLCQRYFQKFTGSQLVLYGYWDGTNSAVLSMPYPVTPRTSPTGLAVSSASHFIVNNSTVGNPTASAVLFNSASLYAMQLEAQVASGGSSNGKACRMLASNSSASIEITGCEL